MHVREWTTLLLGRAGGETGAMLTLAVPMAASSKGMYHGNEAPVR